MTQSRIEEGADQKSASTSLLGVHGGDHGWHLPTSDTYLPVLIPGYTLHNSSWLAADTIEDHLVVMPRRDRRSAVLRRSAGEVAVLFDRYADEWRSAVAFVSTAREMVLHPAYQRIIGLGIGAVPYIIDELRQAPDHWMWALTAIVGEDHAAGTESLADAGAHWVKWFDSLSSFE